MSRFTQVFQQVASESRAANIPFLMLGDPTIELSLSIIESVIAAGIDALELGIPFSDPIADGPTIQQAASRARSQGVTPDDCFNLIALIRQRHPSLPIGLLVYANLVYHKGLSHFYQMAQATGVDAVLVPDVPAEEALPFTIQAKRHQIHPILLATPACRLLDLRTVAQLSEGFTYVVTRSGVTGTEFKSEFAQAKQIVEKLKKVNAPPAVFGFGIKNTQDIQSAYQHGASGAIIGSALIHELSLLSFDTIYAGTEVKQLTKKLFGIEC